jgi:CMP-N-acetylneuraminic acid synthetase
MTRIAALVPMRHSSERVPEKNYRPCGGKPLYHHILQTLLACPEIQRIGVDTDSPVIKAGLRSEFPQVLILDRPKHLRAGDVPMNEVLLHDVSQIEADFYLQTHSTNPLIQGETISQALTTFFNAYPRYDSLFSVTRLHTRLWDPETQPINHNPDVLLRTQDLPPVFEENSCLYLFSRESLESRRNRLGERPLMFEIDSAEAWDIDDELDFQIVDFLLRSREGPAR